MRNNLTNKQEFHGKTSLDDVLRLWQSENYLPQLPKDKEFIEQRINEIKNEIMNI